MKHFLKITTKTACINKIFIFCYANNMICLSPTHILMARICIGQVRQSNVLYSFESHSIGMGRLNPFEVRVKVKKPRLDRCRTRTYVLFGLRQARSCPLKYG